MKMKYDFSDNTDKELLKELDYPFNTAEKTFSLIEEVKKRELSLVVVQQLLKILPNEEDPRLTSYYIYLIGLLGYSDNDVLEILFEKMESAMVIVSLSAIEAISKIHYSDNLLDKLFKKLKDKDPWIVLGAIGAISNLEQHIKGNTIRNMVITNYNKKKVIDALVNCLSNLSWKSKEVVNDTLQLLEKFGKSKVDIINDMLRQLSNGDVVKSRIAVDILGNIGDSTENTQIVTLLVGRLISISDLGSVLKIIVALSKLGNTETAFRALRMMIKHDNLLIRKAAINALGDVTSRMPSLMTYDTLDKLGSQKLLEKEVGELSQSIIKLLPQKSIDLDFRSKRVVRLLEVEDLASIRPFQSSLIDMDEIVKRLKDPNYERRKEATITLGQIAKIDSSLESFQNTNLFWSLYIVPGGRFFFASALDLSNPVHFLSFERNLFIKQERVNLLIQKLDDSNSAVRQAAIMSIREITKAQPSFITLSTAKKLIRKLDDLMKEVREEAIQGIIEFVRAHLSFAQSIANMLEEKLDSCRSDMSLLIMVAIGEIVEISSERINISMVDLLIKYLIKINKFERIQEILEGLNNLEKIVELFPSLIDIEILSIKIRGDIDLETRISALQIIKAILKSHQSLQSLKEIRKVQPIIIKRLIDSVVKRLKDSDIETKEIALEIIEEIARLQPSSVDVHVLLTQLYVPSGFKKEVAYSLRKIAEIQPLLIKPVVDELVKWQKDVVIKEAIDETIEIISMTKVELFELQNTNDDIKIAVMRAAVGENDIRKLIEILENYSSSIFKDLKISIIQSIREASVATPTILEIYGAKILNLLIKQLDDMDPKVRLLAIQTIEEMVTIKPSLITQPIIDSVFKRLNDNDAEVTVAVLKIIAKEVPVFLSFTQPIVDAVIKHSDHYDSDVRELAIQSIEIISSIAPWLIESSLTLDMLVEKLGDPNNETRQRFIQVLQVILPHSISQTMMDVLTMSLKDPNFIVRRKAQDLLSSKIQDLSQAELLLLECNFEIGRRSIKSLLAQSTTHNKYAQERVIDLLTKIVNYKKDYIVQILGERAFNELTDYLRTKDREDAYNLFSSLGGIYIIEAIIGAPGDGVLLDNGLTIKSGKIAIDDDLIIIKEPEYSHTTTKLSPSVTIAAFAARELIETLPSVKYFFKEILHLPIYLPSILDNSYIKITMHYVATNIGLYSLTGKVHLLHSSLATTIYASRVIIWEYLANKKHNILEDNNDKLLDSPIKFIKECSFDVSAHAILGGLGNILSGTLTNYDIAINAAVGGMVCYYTYNNGDVSVSNNITRTERSLPYLIDLFVLYKTLQNIHFDLNSPVGQMLAVKQGLMILSAVVTADHITKLMVSNFKDYTYLSYSMENIDHFMGSFYSYFDQNHSEL